MAGNLSKKYIINILGILPYFLGYLLGVFFYSPTKKLIRICRLKFYTGLYTHKLGYIGKNTIILRLEDSLNLKRVRIGNNSLIEKGALLRCYTDTFNNTGEIIIGNNVSIGLGANISSCRKITISDGVLTGRNVMMNDNSHGYTQRKEDLNDIPTSRPIVSKGEIYIDKNVWIGENAVILGNVHIGACSIIGANSVVTKDIPPYTVIGGIPAKIIKNYG